MLPVKYQINKKEWDLFSKEEMNTFVNKIFSHYREHGFPIYPKNNIKHMEDFVKLRDYDSTQTIDEKYIKQSMHCLNLAWSYFPHSWDVRCNGKKTPLEAFNDDETLYKIILKRIKYGTNMSDSGMRKTLRTFTGVQAVSNFRPSAAKAIYNQYKAKNVWDMSGGWGGRLVGALTSNLESYIATEPSTLSYNGLVALEKQFNYNKTKKVTILKQGAEDYLPTENSLDLCFTSPPYYDTEKYSDEETQSYIKFDNINDWQEGFLQKMFKNCHHGLQKNGVMLINIANTKAIPDLEDRTIDAAWEAGFELYDTKQLLLSAMIGTKNPDKKHKTEPIFVFIKRKSFFK